MQSFLKTGKTGNNDGKKPSTSKDKPKKPAPSPPWVEK